MPILSRFAFGTQTDTAAASKVASLCFSLGALPKLVYKTALQPFSFATAPQRFAACRNTLTTTTTLPNHSSSKLCNWWLAMQTRDLQKKSRP